MFTIGNKKNANLGEVIPVPMVIPVNSMNQPIKNLVELVKKIRPKNAGDVAEAEENFRRVLSKLEADSVLLFSLRKTFLAQFVNSNILPALTESGMVSGRGFLQELLQKLNHKILPPLLEENDLLHVVNHVFYRSTDHIWVEGVDKELWARFFTLLGVQVNLKHHKLVKQLHQAVHLICQRTVTLGLEKEIFSAAEGTEYEEYPFVKLDRALQIYLQSYKSEDPPVVVSTNVQHFICTLNECEEVLKKISENRRQKGTSLSQTFVLFRLQQHLERMHLIAEILDTRSLNIKRLLNYFIRIIYYEKKRNSIREFISANFLFIAYQITEHGSKRGIHYITTTRKEYLNLLLSSIGGGIIISVIAVTKNLLAKVAMAPFWQGFAYSINYFIGFQALHETRTTLATKQPAFTASALVHSFDPNYFGNVDLHKIAITIARTIRSQLASFFGNLVVVFPLTFLLAGLYHSATGEYIAEGEAAHRLLENQHPLKSFSLLYACFTGFFLFASGLIAGFVENKIHFGQVGKRLEHHPVFKNTLSITRLEKLARYVENNFGALTGNLALGFFLGMAAIVGKIFGIPFDIRHITISAGNAAIGYYAVGKSETPEFLATVFIGVLLIGILNFAVSFSLAFLVAARSRGVRLRHYPELLVILGRFFRHYPADFIRPPKKVRNPDDLKKWRRKKQ